jgi:RNA polymerase sigma factor (sigma-70 family)
MKETVPTAGLRADEQPRRTGYGFHVFPQDSPCARNPVRFDCSECPLALLPECQLRLDPDRRSVHAARSRRMSGWLNLTPEEADRIASRTGRVHRETGLDVPPAAVGANPAHVLWVWSADPRVTITSAGWARVNSASQQRAPVYRVLLDEPAGLLLMRSVLSSSKAAGGPNRARLMELAAVRSELESRRKPTEKTLTAEQLSVAVVTLREAEGWSLADIVRYAFGVDPLPLTSDSLRIQLRQEVLFAVRAEGMLGTPTDQLRARHDELRESLIVANLPLAFDQAYRARSGFWRYTFAVGASGLDLLQESVFGLVKSVDRFNPARGTAFATYAVGWIRQTIDRWYKDNRYTSRLPIHKQEELADYLEVWDRLRGAAGAVDRVEEIAALLRREWAGDSRLANEAAQALAVADPLSLERLRDAEFGASGEPEEASASPANELVPTPTWELGSADDQATREELGGDIAEVLSRLSAVQRDVLVRRIGLPRVGAPDVGYDVETLASIGDSMGITRERVRQIEAKAVRWLQVSPHAEWFRERWSPRVTP